MDGSKAVGTDGMIKEDYSQNLGEKLENLVERLKRKSYRPQPARRVGIPKENGKTRPLSIYCQEDKLVQEVLKRILEAVFEPHFYDEMMGFRPGRGCHKAIQKLNVMLEKRPTNYVLVLLPMRLKNLDRVGCEASAFFPRTADRTGSQRSSSAQLSGISSVGGFYHPYGFGTGQSHLS